MWIPRDVESWLQRSARTRPVVVLTGARQTGKTSTLQRLFPDHRFISLDLPTEAEQAEKEPDAWTLELEDPVPIAEGAPLIYGFANGTINAQSPGPEIYYDNLKITPNKK